MSVNFQRKTRYWFGRYFLQEMNVSQAVAVPNFVFSCLKHWHVFKSRFLLVAGDYLHTFLRFSWHFKHLEEVTSIRNKEAIKTSPCSSRRLLITHACEGIGFFQVRHSPTLEAEIQHFGLSPGRKHLGILGKITKCVLLLHLLNEEIAWTWGLMWTPWEGLREEERIEMWQRWV